MCWCRGLVPVEVIYPRRPMVHQRFDGGTVLRQPHRDPSDGHPHQVSGWSAALGGGHASSSCCVVLYGGAGLWVRKASISIKQHGSIFISELLI